MASSGSSTTESASDVSLSHLFHLSPRLLPLVLVCVLLLCLLFVCFGLVFVWCCSLCFASAVGCFDLYPRVLDDRQCFIARSAMRKKKSAH